MHTDFQIDDRQMIKYLGEFRFDEENQYYRNERIGYLEETYIKSTWGRSWLKHKNGCYDTKIWCIIRRYTDTNYNKYKNCRRLIINLENYIVFGC